MAMEFGFQAKQIMINIRDITKMIKNMGKVFIFGQMEQYMKETLKTI